MKIPRELALAQRGVIAMLLVLLLGMFTLAQQPAVSELQIVPVRLLIDLICVVLFFSIFIVSWHGYEIHRQSRSVILAVGFLCAAIFNFFGIVNEATTARFASPGYQQITLMFSLLWRITTAVILLFIAIDNIGNQRARALAQWVLKAGLCFLAGCGLLVFFILSHSSTLQLAGNWPSLVKALTQAGLIGLFLLASLLFYFSASQNTLTANLTEKSYLFAACAALAMAEFCSSELFSSYRLFGLSVQIFQFIGALGIYFSLVTINLRTPFAQLAYAKQELLTNRDLLNGIIQTATDGIITIDAKHHIILVNRAAEKYFGYENQEMLGMHLDQFIPMRNRADHSRHVDQFGVTGISIRQMGVDNPDFSVTALKKTGEEFPVEASISSLIDGDRRFFTVIFRDINDRKTAKLKMDQYHQELSDLSQSLQTVREEERKHIARELHDDLGQLLAALRMDFSVLEKKLPEHEAVRPILKSMDNLILNAITTLRRIATDLRPRALDEGGLFFALQTLQKDFNQRHKIDCVLNAHEDDLILNDAISTTIYRVIQESLTNVVRHAHATRVVIDLTRSENKLNFKISDNGRGISEQDFAKRQSFGLVGMRERVRALHGELHISGNANTGTCIEIVIPVDAAK